MESNVGFHGGSTSDDIGIKRIPLESFNCYVDEVSAKVDKLQQRMNNVEQLRSTLLKKSPHNSKSGFLEEQDQDASKKGAAAPYTAHKLLHHYNNILCQELKYTLQRPFNFNSRPLLGKEKDVNRGEKEAYVSSLSRLEPNDLNTALEIVATNNPGFEALAAEVDLYLDYQSEATLWRLKFFVQRALGTHVTGSIVTNGDITNAAQIAAPVTTNANTRTTSTRKKRKKIDS